MHKFKQVWFILFLYAVSSVHGQMYWFWIGFSDKNNSSCSLERPQEFLSQKTINRRAKFNIPITYTDIPVNQNYIDEIKSRGLHIEYSLKWFNGAVITTQNQDIYNLLKDISFITEIKPVGKAEGYKSYYNKFEELIDINERFQDSFTQINQLNSFFLQNSGYKGNGITIAVIDGGFYHANVIEGLSHLWQNGQILGYKDFANPASDFFEQHWHGMSVLSVMAGYVPNKLEGAAPDAGYWLLRSEVVSYEQPVEEYNWCAAAEFADSIGADIINSSLGYSVFDNIFDNHSYKDLDGKTIICSRAATMAARKGILVVNSAGNEGNDNWYYITAPSDADSVLSIGAIDAFGQYVDFSSHGPSSDKRVKPDVAAQGYGVTLLNSFGQVGLGSGTSFSSPIIAGMAACLWQANPDATNIEVLKAIQQSASVYINPDDEYGYGIPDFEKAYYLLSERLLNDDNNMKVIADGISGKVKVKIISNNPENIKILVYDVQGKCHFNSNINIYYLYQEIDLDISGYNNGLYFIKIERPGSKPLVIKTVKFSFE